jgi:diguanylate cyclase (GGDEF)-like protein
LNYAALFDILTGAPNRFYFLQTMDRALQSHARTNTSLALVAVNIRNFGRINDSFSKSGGDRLLTMIVERLTEGSQFGCARISANTFAVALSDLNGNSDVAQALYKHVLEPLSRSFLIGGVQLNIACRCGIAVFPADGNNSEELFGNAEAALKSAKDQGEEYLFYTPALNAQVAEQIALESELREAIAGQQFVLYYQSKVESGSGRLIGFEALIRWNSPEHGQISPAEFVPIAEETGLILDLGDWITRQAFKDCRRWGGPYVSVNLSARQFLRHNVAERILQYAEDADVPADRIQIELTETAIIDDVVRAAENLAILRAAGVRVALDDFGTGYSSLVYLNQFAIDCIKIDKSFVDTITRDRQSAVIVASVARLAASLGMSVVAEGVETEEQRQILIAAGCGALQGFHFGRPMIASDVAAVLKGQAPRR